MSDKPILTVLHEWIAKFPAGEGFPTSAVRNILQQTVSEIEQLQRENEQLKKELFAATSSRDLLLNKE